MQIAGKAFDEPMVYRIAWAYCEAAGWASVSPKLRRSTAAMKTLSMKEGKIFN
jgi:hypothetical protein